MPAGNNKPNGIIPQKNVVPIAREPTIINITPTNFVLVLRTNGTRRIPIYIKNEITNPPSNIDITFFVSSCSSRAVKLEDDAL